MAKNDEQFRGFKGIWVPRDIYLDARLSRTEKDLLVEIDSLDNDEKGCFASNAYLASFLGLRNSNTVSNMIARLIKRGEIKVLYFDGKNRGLRSLRHRPNERETVEIPSNMLHKKMDDAPQKSGAYAPQKSGHINKEKKQTETECTPLSESAFSEYRKEVVEWYCSKLGIVSLPPRTDVSTDLRWLFTNNFTVSDLDAFYDFAKTETWRKGKITISAIAKGIGDWRSQQQSSQKKPAVSIPVNCTLGCNPDTGLREVVKNGQIAMVRCKHK